MSTAPTVFLLETELYAVSECRGVVATEKRRLSRSVTTRPDGRNKADDAMNASADVYKALDLCRGM